MSAINGLIVGTAAAASVVIDEKAMLPIGTFITLAGVVWWMGRKLQKIDDQLEHMQKGQDVLTSRVNALPCKRVADACNPSKK